MPISSNSFNTNNLCIMYDTKIVGVGEWCGLLKATGHSPVAFCKPSCRIKLWNTYNY